MNLPKQFKHDRIGPGVPDFRETRGGERCRMTKPAYCAFIQYKPFPHCVGLPAAGIQAFWKQLARSSAKDGILPGRDMCTNYAAARRDQLFKHFGTEPPDSPWRDEIYKDYPAPIIRRIDGAPRASLATFGIVPRKHIPPGVKVFDTMNARAETVGEKRSFSGAWKKQQLCLIACDAFYEPDYETGKAVRWCIGMADGSPFAIAGLWREWAEEGGESRVVHDADRQC